MHIDAYDYSEYRPSYVEHDLLMDRKEREITLMKLGYTRADLANATRQSLKEKKKRRQTVDNLSVAYMEEKVEGIKKSLRRNVLRKKGTKSMYKDWKKIEKNNGICKTHSDDQDTWHMAQSILVLGKEDSERSGGSDKAPNMVTTEGDEDALSQSIGEEPNEDEFHASYPSFKSKSFMRA